VTYTILTDTSCNLTEELIARYKLEILPLRFMCEGVEYTSFNKDASTDLTSFYVNMRAGKVYTTSLPNQEYTAEVIRGLLEADQDILYVGFSSGISGTYEATAALLEQIALEFPERKIMHIDTRAAALGEGLCVLRAAEMREAGASIEEVFAWLEANVLHVAHWFTVDDLMYLYRGGRVSRTSATAANILSIKPVLHVDDEGLLIPMSKSRGRKKSIQALVDQMKETWDPSYGPQHVGISHGDCLEDVLELKALIEAEPDFEIQDFIINILDPVIGAHAGPGTLALFFMATGR